MLEKIDETTLTESLGSLSLSLRKSEKSSTGKRIAFKQLLFAGVPRETDLPLEISSNESINYVRLGSRTVFTIVSHDDLDREKL